VSAQDETKKDEEANE
jgi:hypothetical protein